MQTLVLQSYMWSSLASSYYGLVQGYFYDDTSTLSEILKHTMRFLNETGVEHQVYSKLENIQHKEFTIGPSSPPLPVKLSVPRPG